MVGYYISLRKFSHPVRCLGRKGTPSASLHIKAGDVIEVTNDCKLFKGAGWFFMVEVNGKNCGFIAHEELVNYLNDKKLVTMLDIELHINYLKYKLDLALDERNKVCFNAYTKKLTDYLILKTELEKYAVKKEFFSFV
ncbi:hypothetical protein [Salipaludibacillus aurantiacus]|uniref:SH3 domain-containing protein n=1 Tax=Salipaludibacillus aurantiacus TaxID=1601833 RepID=A0A1H9VXP6_9BACI|nr:hypothetical protein [Salipaludibacillus aurantiacus]SES26137.1 hypothetical protein SAMN05518684_11322 [Salipaludibacillus aurantiacus]